MKRQLAILTGVLLLTPIAFAMPYPDVPSDSLYSESIYGLQRLGIMRGNDDGTFGYGDPLNRAALLTLAYRAADKEVRAIYYNGSFSDVPNGEWFTDVFYTAKHDGVIQGYTDGTARPDDTVNLVEALKIILNALGIPLPVLTQEDRLSVGGFVGTTTGAWYLPWLNTAFLLDLLPDVLLEDNHLKPGGPVTREVAAEILFHALNADISIFNDLAIIENPDNYLDQEPVQTTEEEGPSEKATFTGAPISALPMQKTGETGERGASAFAFNVDEKTTVFVNAKNLTSISAGLQCFLYYLPGDQGFSSEFFIGYEEDGSCFIRGALRPGRYQIEIRSPSEGAKYSLDIMETTGDGNDGFVEAVALSVGVARSATLAAHDYEDWYKFIVLRPETHRVKISSSHSPSCMLFPGDNVDLASFSVPQCGVSAEYEKGTWYISVKKQKDAEKSMSYTIELR